MNRGKKGDNETNQKKRNVCGPIPFCQYLLRATIDNPDTYFNMYQFDLKNIYIPII